ncbi:hypothetical protein SAY87_020956 [Trapa incisa]|uniref:40S ribosomal protein S29 n=1 Tax=Trapa incisa TaxID=236973 RepID=A0AAN7JRE2_9MYRT|nr:hypothetical protein SAY87_020956 [Trapa incisa]
MAYLLAPHFRVSQSQRAQEERISLRDRRQPWVTLTSGILIRRSTVPDLAPVSSFCEISMLRCFRVCGNPHAIIRKYGLMCCRQCFRSNAKEIGFIKVNLYSSTSTFYVRMMHMLSSSYPIILNRSMSSDSRSLFLYSTGEDTSAIG